MIPASKPLYWGWDSARFRYAAFPTTSAAGLFLSYLIRYASCRNGFKDCPLHSSRNTAASISVASGWINSCTMRMESATSFPPLTYRTTACGSTVVSLLLVVVISPNLPVP